MMNLAKILIVLGILSVTTNANIINLYNKLHFYEIKLESMYDYQSYDTIVLGDGNCANISPESHVPLQSNSAEQDGQTKIEKKYNLDVKTLIYSNYEKTLSFILQIEFSTINLPNQFKIEGYELKFVDGSSKSCVQILTNFSDDSHKSKQRYRLKIKDPSFLSHLNPRFSFYFGQISVRALVACDDQDTISFNGNYLCALQSVSSSLVKMGIKSEMLTDTSKITPDLCEGHLMTQTCIIRYPLMTIKGEEDYFIVMHAMTNEFESVIGDIDVFELDDDQLKKVEEAKKKGKQSINVEGFDYDIASFSEQTKRGAQSVHLVPNIVSNRNQILKNGLVIKFIKYNNKANYVGILFSPTNENTCHNSTKGEYCRCNDECRQCYNLETHKQKGDKGIINYIPLNYENELSPQDSKKKKRSKHCSDPFFKGYNFDGIEMAKEFQNQGLSEPRKSLSLTESAKFISNRDSIARPCINFKHGEAKGFYNLELIFNDYSHVGLSSLINETLYSIKIYEYNYEDNHIHKNKIVGKKDLFKLKIKLIKERDSISPKDNVKILNLKHSKYFLELIPRQKSSFCPGEDECIDESSENNKIQCIKCSRLLMKFDLQSKLVADLSSIESNKKYSKDHCNRIAPDIILSYAKKIDYNENFKCPKSSNVLSSIIKSDPNYDLNEIFFKTEIMSCLIPYDYNVLDMKLPFDQAEVRDLVEFCDGIEFVDIVRNKFFIAITSIFFLIIFVFVLIYLLSFRNIPKYIFASNKKNVVFYLSIFLSTEQQKRLHHFILKYTDLLNKKFQNLSIKIIDYSTDCQLRAELLEHADKIVYVCATKEELTNNLLKPLIIGQNKFHDEYNKIHFFKQYSSKTVDITFNHYITERDRCSNDSNSERSSLLNSNSSNESNQTTVELGLSSKSSSTNMVKAQIHHEPIKQLCLIMPKQHRELILFLLSSNKTDNQIPVYTQNSHLDKNAIYRIALDYYINDFKNSLLNLIQKEKSDIFFFEKNIIVDDQTTTIDKIIEPDYEILIRLSSINSSSSTRSVSNESSKTSFDANEISNETEQTEQRPLIRHHNYF